MFLLKPFSAIMVAVTFSICVKALEEQHTIVFNNICGDAVGTPRLIDNLSSGSSISSNPFTSNGPIIGFRAFLQTGKCGIVGDGCPFISITLSNVAGSSATITADGGDLIFQRTIGFGYFNGCNGAGAKCNSPASCDASAVECNADDVNLAITFCDDTQ